MSVYLVHLPLAFPFSVEVSVPFAAVAAGALVMGHSSYAVTTDTTEPEHRILWLSEVSRVALLDLLTRAGYLTEPGHWRGATSAIGPAPAR